MLSRGRTPRKGGCVSMPRRYKCCHGLCNMRSTDTNENLRLLPFAKPCGEFISTLVDHTKIHNVHQCVKCSKSLRWIHLCKRPDNLKTLVDISKTTYICTKHFPNGLGPTETHPDPYPAESAMLEDELSSSRRQRQPPKDLSELPSHPLKKRHSPEVMPLEFVDVGATIDVQAPDERITNSFDNSSTVIIPKHQSIAINHTEYSIKTETKTEPEPETETETVNEPETVNKLELISLTLLNNNLYIRFSGDSVEVTYLRDHIVEKLCHISDDLKITLKCLNVELGDEHEIWKLTPKYWNDTFDYVTFLKEFFNWKVCKSSDNPKFQEYRELKDLDYARYDLITHTLRSPSCKMLVTEYDETCSHCLKMVRRIRLNVTRLKYKVVANRKVSHMSREEAQTNLRNSRYKLKLERRKLLRVQKKLDTIRNGTKFSESDNDDVLTIQHNTLDTEIKL